MTARNRWIVALLLYHLMLGTLFLLWGKTVPTTHWSGSLLAFGLPTVQFTWGFTIGMILGPRRSVRRWYWTAFLFCPIPLSFIYIASMLAFHFFGAYLATICGVVGVAVVLLETIAGVIVGIGARTKFGGPQK